MSLRLRLRVMLGIAVFSLGIAGWQAIRIVSIYRWNRMIESGVAGADVAHAPPEVRFAAAYALARSGAVRESLDAYRSLLAEGDARLRHDAMFNAGNLYLQQAIEARSQADRAASSTLAELAKASYRELLRESDDWDARYNLERALRVAPDPDDEAGENYVPPTRLRNAPAETGTSLGLP